MESIFAVLLIVGMIVLPIIDILTINKYQKKLDSLYTVVQLNDAILAAVSTKIGLTMEEVLAIKNKDQKSYYHYETDENK